MANFEHAVTGVKVTVAEGKELGPDWVPADDETKKARSPRVKKSE